MLPDMRQVKRSFLNFCNTPVFIFKQPDTAKNKDSIVFFPMEYSKLNCGLSGIVSFKKCSINANNHAEKIISEIQAEIGKIKNSSFNHILETKASHDKYLGGVKLCENILQLARQLKTDSLFSNIYNNENFVKQIHKTALEISSFCQEESLAAEKNIGYFSPEKSMEIINSLEILKDAAWTLEKEIYENIKKIEVLSKRNILPNSVPFYRKINTVLNSINILEVRGRDSAGISVFVTFNNEDYEQYINCLKENSLDAIFNHRKNISELTNYKISINKQTESDTKTIAFTYKFAAETGALGDNIAFIRNQIKNDLLLHKASEIECINVTVGAHTRWASVGEISQLNCHPVDSSTTNKTKNNSNLIHVSLNGDIDNYQELKAQFEDKTDKIQENITTDTKIIPLQISSYYYEGYSIEESFRLAVNDFKGSHAILMQTDIAPGKIFLAQRGSGQAIFVGISEDSYTIASEVYGFVERTQSYYKLQGESLDGQIVILNENSDDKIKGIKSYTYLGEEVKITKDLIQTTPITSRDVDRQNFKHFFLKEIFEAPSSVRKTIQGRWEICDTEKNLKKVSFDESIFPQALKKEFLDDKIKRIFFIGQGTAGVAANAASVLVSHYINKPLIQVASLKASELSGFILDEQSKDLMADSLVVAITQSGTTTDTNKSIDMAKSCGAKTLAIVNRRDSDITFKVDGVLYTSTGRDIEMSVASTKAFYSQVTAGSLLGLYISDILKTRDAGFISKEIDTLTNLPKLMEQVLDDHEKIKQAAITTAPRKTYWATVGSGPNKAAADEIRIKLSELCYRTISADYVEDKKHIDLSSEPLIIVCAAGTREAVLSDIIKDNAIFKAHKSTTVVISDENEKRFDLDADAIIKVPKIQEHLAPVLVTLAGHLWGYYAAGAINENSKFFYNNRVKIQQIINNLKAQQKELFEIVLEKEFKETIASFYSELRQVQNNENFFSLLPPNFMSDLILVLNYLYGRLNASDFEMDFNEKGTPANMINRLFSMISQAIDTLARPIDAIKHQAKTVTVGTSRIAEKFEGVVFEEILKNKISTDQITPQNLFVINNLQGVINDIKGAVLYKIDDLNLLGEPTVNTKISIISKTGNLKKIPSRVEKDNTLKGTKKIIVSEGNVFIGKGQKDGRSILVVPLTSSGISKKHQRIEFLLSLEISFKEKIPLYVKVKALGGKLERIKNNVQENNIQWKNDLLEILKPEELFGFSYEKIVDKIVQSQLTN